MATASSHDSPCPPSASSRRIRRSRSATSTPLTSAGTARTATAPPSQRSISNPMSVSSCCDRSKAAISCGARSTTRGSSSGLTVDGSLPHLAEDALVKDALVGGVLVDQVHAVRPFGDDEAGGDLAQHPQERNARTDARPRRRWVPARPRSSSISMRRSAAARTGSAAAAPAAIVGIGSNRMWGSSACGAASQRGVHGPLHGAAGRAFVDEFHLGLGGMDVDVDRRRIEPHVDRRQRDAGPTRRREWYASSRAKPSARFCTQRPLTKMTMPCRWERDSSGEVIQPSTCIPGTAAELRRAVPAGSPRGRPPAPRPRSPRRWHRPRHR